MCIGCLLMTRQHPLPSLPVSQDIAAPGTPPPQARMSRFGAAQAGRQGTGQSTAAQHGDQPPTGPNDRMQDANPYRSLGEPGLSQLSLRGPCPRSAAFHLSLQPGFSSLG